MRLGIFGGTFDPPHLAHAMACLWALETGQVDRVLIIPVWQHAFGKQPRADFEHRLEMCRLTVASLSHYVEVSDIEKRRGGTSYMADTLEHLAEERPGDTFRLLIGSDVAKDLDAWKAPARVRELAPLLEIPRPIAGEDRPFALPDISSTAIREALRTGKGVELLVGKRIREYIEKNGLYSSKPA